MATERDRSERRGRAMGRFLPRETAQHLKAAIAEAQLATRSLVFALIDRLEAEEKPGPGAAGNGQTGPGTSA